MDEKKNDESEIETEDKDGRKKLKKERNGKTLHFTILAKVPKENPDDERVEEVDGYVTTGEYSDGALGEFFVCMSRKGASSEMAAIVAAMGPSLDAWAKACSVALQYGAPLVPLLGLEVSMRYAPAGPVRGVAGVRWCSSPTDLIARFLISKYAPKLEDRVRAFVGRGAMEEGVEVGGAA